MRKGQDSVTNVAWFIAIIALFLVIYTVLLPEEEKVKLITDPGAVGEPYLHGGRGTSVVPGQPFIQTELLLSETPGLLYPYAQNLFVKPMASVNLFSTVEKREEQLTTALSLQSSLFSGDEKEYSFTLLDPRSVQKIQLLFVMQSTRGDLQIELNGQEIFSGKVTSGDLPIVLPPSLLRIKNTLTFSVGASALGGNAYALRDVSLFISDRQENILELRDFSLSKSQLYNLEGLTLYYFVNCFTVQERGTLRIFLNGNLLSQQLVVCDAGEVSQDLPVSHLLQGRNILEFNIDNGQFVLEQLSVEGNTGQGRVPSYFFTLQVEDISYGAPVGLDIKFYDDRFRKVGTIFVNGFPLYIDTSGNGVFFDISPYIAAGQNVIKIVPDTEMDIVDLEVFLG